MNVELNTTFLPSGDLSLVFFLCDDEICEVFFNRTSSLSAISTQHHSSSWRSWWRRRNRNCFAINFVCKRTKKKAFKWWETFVKLIVFFGAWVSYEKRIYLSIRPETVEVESWEKCQKYYLFFLSQSHIKELKMNFHFYAINVLLHDISPHTRLCFVFVFIFFSLLFLILARSAFCYSALKRFLIWSRMVFSHIVKKR